MKDSLNVKEKENEHKRLKLSSQFRIEKRERKRV